jgi:hypothetical protein
MFYSIGLEMNISIPFEPKTLERLLELIREAGEGPRVIEIVNPKLPTARVVACAQVAAGGSQQRAQVERSGRCRREAAAGRGRASDTSRRGRRTASRGARAAPAPRCKESRLGAPRGA